MLAKAATPVENLDALSWLPSLSTRKQPKPMSQGLQARLWSPPVPAELGLRCLKFVYFIHPGAGRTSSNITLSLLQRQEGLTQTSWLNVVALKSIITAVAGESLRGSHGISLDTARSVVQGCGPTSCLRSFLCFPRDLRSHLLPVLTGPAPLAVCRFDNADTCGWINDVNNWKQRWTIVKTTAWMPRVWTHTMPALCLTTEAPNRPPQQQFSSSWVPVTGKKKPKTSGPSVGSSIQARFWSPSIPSELGIKCLQLAYHIHLGRPSPVGTTLAEDKSLNLALLQRQEGCFRVLPSLCLVSSPFNTTTRASFWWNLNRFHI
ncbi:unnamed protein product [Dibothriocephalus latus]|uniref:MAM domain-containing protein n=1 Tax=Dibothriocephalus latus TaxID=60516 RepID=A0A3P7P4Z1_DIBLA|nr:unnamed protein product [Dibothriocephalus latus]